MDSERDQIEKYLKGTLTSAERHALERRALDDPFLSDALEGGSRLSPEEFSADVQAIQAKIKGAQSRSLFTPMRMAAGVVLIISMSLAWLWLSNDPVDRQSGLIVQKDRVDSAKADAPPITAKPNEDQRLTLNEPKPVVEQPRSARAARETAPAKEPVTESQAADREEVEAAEEQTKADAQEEDVVRESKVTEAKAETPLAQQEELRELTSRAMKKQAADAPSAAGAKLATRQIQGQVKSETGEPLPGVNVLQKGTTYGTVTDAQGYYALQLSDPSVPLVFSFIGMKTSEVATGDQDRMDVTLAEDMAQLSEVVVTGLRSGETEARAPVIKLAEPYGGRKAYDQYLEKNLRYPVRALEQKVKGRVTIEFTVQTDGALGDFQVLRSLGYGCDEEVIRLVKEGPKWFPTTEDNVPVESNVRVRMKFDRAKAGK